MKKKRYYVFVPPTLHGSSQPSSGFEPDPDPDKHPLHLLILPLPLPLPTLPLFLPLSSYLSLNIYQLFT